MRAFLMNLHLPTLLRRALLACVACSTTAHAATYVAEGVDPNNLYTSDRFYDGGKGRDWGDFARNAYRLYADHDKDIDIFGELAADIIIPQYSNTLDFSKLTDDRGHCWAYTSANMIQYWQTYYGVFAHKAGEEATLPPVHGYTYDKAFMEQLGGTQSLKLNKLFYDNWKGSAGGSTKISFAWYMAGDNEWSGMKTDAPGGYFRQYFTDPNTANRTTNVYDGPNIRSLASLSESMKSHLGYETAADGTLTQTTKGQIMYLELTKNLNDSHAITCYGFDTDADGNISALYVVNSDDAQYELVKVYGRMEENGFGLYYDEACTQTWNGWRVTGWSSINTPTVLRQMLSEYENANLAWMGTLDSWTDTSALATTEALPTDATGWKAYAGSNTPYAGYYNSYYATGRGVEFNDSATSGTVNVGEDLSVPSMAVNNSTLAYTFSGTGETISADSFTKSGTGSLAFEGVKLVAGSATLGSDVRFDQLHVTGTLQASGRKVLANSVRLDGDAVAGFIGEGAGEFATGTTALTITGGMTTVQNSTSWTALKSLELSPEARLSVGASVSVAENITATATTTGTLPDGTKAGINARYCIRVGTDGVAGTGNVELDGDMTAGSYIKILGNADVTGKLTSTGKMSDHHVTILGNANIGGEFASGTYVAIGGDADVGGRTTVSGNMTVGGALNMTQGGTVGGRLSAGSLTLASGQALTATRGLTVTGDVAGGAPAQAGDAKAAISTSADMVLRGSVSNIELQARNLTLNAADGSELTVDSAGITLMGGELNLRHATVQGDTRIRSGLEQALTMRVNDVTFVLDGSNSSLAASEQSAELAGSELPSNPIHLHSTLLHGINVSGTLTLDLSYWMEEIHAGNHDSVALSFADNSDFSGADEVTLALGNGNTALLRAEAERPHYFNFAVVRPQAAIPEPAAATLSLLALAALAARRRRK